MACSPGTGVIIVRLEWYLYFESKVIPKEELPTS